MKVWGFASWDRNENLMSFYVGIHLFDICSGVLMAQCSPRLPFTVDYLEPNPGLIYDFETGETLGTHKGLWTYTVGQGARLPGLGERYFVTSKCKKKNAIYIVSGS